MSDIHRFTSLLSEADRQVMEILHKEITQLPDIAMKTRYKLPFYFGRSWICYLNPLKKGGVELAFIRGNELGNPHGLLDHRGRKQIAGIIYRQSTDIQIDLIRDCLYEAYTLDREVPYGAPGRRKP